MEQDGGMVTARRGGVDTITHCVSDDRSTLVVSLHGVVTENLSGIALRLDDNDSPPLVPSQHTSAWSRSEIRTWRLRLERSRDAKTGWAITSVEETGADRCWQWQLD